jgi:hypothetical protein
VNWKGLTKHRVQQWPFINIFMSVRFP